MRVRRNKETEGVKREKNEVIEEKRRGTIGSNVWSPPRYNPPQGSCLRSDIRTKKQNIG
jgi:hypothetical protein